VYYDILSHD